MPNDRRYRLPGSCYFFTVNLLEHRKRLLVEHIDLLRESFRVVKHQTPFHIDAIVVLPKHLHYIWTLPLGNDNYSGRWRAIKKHFSKNLPRTERLSSVRFKWHKRGIWQRRFWEHVIMDEMDYTAHIDYCHINPVKHGLVKKVSDWPYSTFHRYVEQGVYPIDWATSLTIDFVAGERH